MVINYDNKKIIKNNKKTMVASKNNFLSKNNILP